MAAAAAALLIACATPARAVNNPTIVNIKPWISGVPQGSVSFFQTGNDVVVNVSLGH
ncbi:MAG: hypothetical protein NVS2B17_26020 [Candidatus Velthaea sp.]